MLLVLLKVAYGLVELLLELSLFVLHFGNLRFEHFFLRLELLSYLALAILEAL